MELRKIGKFIAERRKAQKITQEKLAEMLDVSDRAVSKWERGICLPSTAVMPKLCEILSITVNELFCGERINMKDDKKTEKALLEIARAKERADKKLLNLEVIIGVAVLVMFIPSVILLAYADMQTWIRCAMLLILVIFVVTVSFVLLSSKVTASPFTKMSAVPMPKPVGIDEPVMSPSKIAVL
jgi:transcriptional regulator with XRE-family HTH domain